MLLIMNKYAVAILSFFENQNKIFIVEADTEVNAMKKALIKFCTSDEAKKSQEEWQTSWETVDEVINECFNGELGISEPVLISEFKDN